MGIQDPPAPDAGAMDQTAVERLVSGGSHRFPWGLVGSVELRDVVAAFSDKQCGVTFGTLGYGVLGSLRVMTPDGRDWRSSWHEADEATRDLRVLSSPAAVEYVVNRAEKREARRRR